VRRRCVDGAVTQTAQQSLQVCPRHEIVVEIRLRNQAHFAFQRFLKSRSKTECNSKKLFDAKRREWCLRQIYLRRRVTLTFDLLISKSWPVHVLAPWTTWTKLHRNRFTRFRNIVLTSLIDNRRLKEHTNKRTQNIVTFNKWVYNYEAPCLLTMSTRSSAIADKPRDAGL